MSSPHSAFKFCMALQWRKLNCTRKSQTALYSKNSTYQHSNFSIELAYNILVHVTLGLPLCIMAMIHMWEVQEECHFIYLIIIYPEACYSRNTFYNEDAPKCRTLTTYTELSSGHDCMFRTKINCFGRAKTVHREKRYCWSRLRTLYSGVNFLKASTDKVNSQAGTLIWKLASPPRITFSMCIFTWLFLLQ